jgi:putative hydrolase of the HAD superfamily
LQRIRCIAWDFDGVLNRNVINGQFIWQDQLAEFGIERKVFEKFMFSDGFWPIMRGEEDLLDRLKRFRDHAVFEPEAEELLQYWFARDAHPCGDMLALMARAEAVGLRQIIATNNEHRRSSYIENEMGYGARIEKLYSSGRMGVAKPDAGYFRAIEEDMALKPNEILFVDDYRENIDAAEDCGWQVHHFSEDGHADLAQRLAVIL